MLIITLNWIYMLFTIFCIGFAVSAFSEKMLHYSFRRMDSVLMAGMAAVTVYAQIFSLFYRVNIEANICLVLLCAVIIAALGKRMMSFLKEAFRGCSTARKILIPVLFFIWCYFTSRGYMVLDASLYHAQSIRWIEEYGVVKGLGNLNGRIAYNSAIFAVSALYSMVFAAGQSLHAVNGLLAFIASLEILNLGKCFRRKKMLLSDFARAGLFYYLSLICDEILAPSSDYAAMLVVFFIVIKWLVQLEDPQEKDDLVPYSLLCVLSVFAVTLKLSAGLIVLLVLKPACGLLKEKRWKEIGLYLTLGLLTAVPWMARSVVISGWLFYPFASLDLFQVDWKMKDVGLINTDAAQIKIWAQGANAFGIDAPFRQWFPNWFLNHLTLMEKLIVTGDVLSLAVVVIAGLWALVKRQREKFGALFVLFVMVCCYLFWQFSAPMPRYGYAYILLLAALTAGWLLQDRPVPARPVYLLLILYGIYKVCMVCGEAAVYLDFTPYYIRQQDYEEPDELVPCELDGVTVYASPAGSILGYEHFPAAGSMEMLDRIGLRGDGLEDGFRMK